MSEVKRNLTKQLTLITFASFLLVSSSYKTVILHPPVYKILTTSVASRDVANIFDGDKDTQGLIYSEVGTNVEFLINLGAEYQVDRVEIISDEPAQLMQTVRVGYPHESSLLDTSVAYECKAGRTYTNCTPGCQRPGPVVNRPGVVGNSLLWTVKRTEKTGWNRFYDFIIWGSSMTDRVVVKDRVADISSLKPYQDHSQTLTDPESCDNALWKLIDPVVRDSKSSPPSVKDMNMTVIFGRTYSVSKVALVMSSEDGMPKEIELHFGGLKPLSKSIQLSECSVQDEKFALVSCPTYDLSGFPFDRVTFNTKGVINLQVFGMPFYYPQMVISTSKKPSVRQQPSQLHISCAAAGCGSTSGSVTTMGPGANSGIPSNAASCARYGRHVGCQKIELLRLPSSITTDPDSQPLTLISDGQVVPALTEALSGMKVVKSTAEELVVDIPPTYHYFGQYQCKCLADDTLYSALLSPSTDFEPEDFDQDLVFQRNYTAMLGDTQIDAQHGLIELPEDQSEGYFKLIIAGHTLFKDVDLNSSFIEGGNRTSMSGAYAQKSAVDAFPSLNGSIGMWPVPAFKVELQDAWPDVMEDNHIIISWSIVGEKLQRNRKLEDHLRTVVLDPTKDGTLRAWVWQRTTDRLQFRIYYQSGQSDAATLPTRTLYLQRSTCSALVEPTTVIEAQVSGDSCTTTIEDVAHCLKTNGGYVLVVNIEDPLASDSYSLYQKTTDEGAEDTKLVEAVALEKNLDEEIMRTNFSTRVITVNRNTEESRTTIGVEVEVLSKVVVDNSGCREITVSLTPNWSVEERVSKRLQGSITSFTVEVPDAQETVDLLIHLAVSPKDGTDKPVEVRTNIQFPNPGIYKPPLTIDDRQGTVSWPALPVVLRPSLYHYRAQVTGTVQACNEERQFTPQLISAVDDGATFSLRLSENADSAILKHLMVNYIVKIQPVYKMESGFSDGATSTVDLVQGSIGNSKVSFTSVATPRSAQFYVFPSQSLNCAVGKESDVKFELRAVGVSEEDAHLLTEAATLDREENAKGTETASVLYTIENLIPGRYYELRASFVYPNNMKDDFSEWVPFNTTDEVSISTTKLFVSPGARVVVDCVGVVGPAGSHQKSLEWRRLDGTQLPEGGRSELKKTEVVGPEWKATVSLIFDKVEKGQANTYACFIRPYLENPKATVKAPFVTITVSELELDLQTKAVSVGGSLKVTCSTDQSGTLAWISPSGERVPVVASGDDVEKGQKTFAVVDAAGSTNGRNILTLHIVDAELNLAGDYVCEQQEGENRRVFKLRMEESVAISPHKESSNRSGEKMILECISSRGLPDQQTEWFVKSLNQERLVSISSLPPEQASMVALVNHNPNSVEAGDLVVTLTVVNTPSSSGDYICLIRSNQDTDRDIAEVELDKYTRAVYRHVVEPVLEISKAISVGDNEVHIQCTGYPAQPHDRLQWTYFAQQTGVEPIPIDAAGVMQQSDDAERVRLATTVRSLLRLGDSIPATWPGSAGPQMLMAVSAIRSGTNGSPVSTPERLDLILTKPANEDLDIEQLLSGFLACQYKRPRILLSDNDQSTSFVPPLVATGEARGPLLVMKQMVPMHEIYNGGSPTKPISDDPSVAAASGLKNGNFAYRLSPKLAVLNTLLLVLGAIYLVEQ